MTKQFAEQLELNNKLTLINESNIKSIVQA